MSVYVLMAAEQYEGESLVGVYGSLKEAQYAAGHYQARSEMDDRSEGFCAGADFYNVYCVELGQVGRYHADDQVVWCSAS